MMQDATDCVREFHEKMRAPVSAVPTLLPCDVHAAAELTERVAALAAETMARASTSDVLLRRAAMALEELAEWLEAHAEGNLVAAADAWADLAMVTVMMERYDIALPALDKVKQLNAEKPGHKYLRAITLDKIKQNKQQAKLAAAAYQDFLNSAGGMFPDEEFKARQRMKILDREINR